jgi:hypothetical protein
VDLAGAYVENATGVTLAGIDATPGGRVCAEVAIEGRYVLRAVAIDRVGLVAVSETPLVIVDIAPPQLELVSPLPRHVYAGPLVTERPPEPAVSTSPAIERAHHPRARDIHLKEHLPRLLVTTRVPAEPPGLPLGDAPIVVGTADVVANASDPGAGIALGELFIDDALVGTAASAPFQWTIGLGLTPGWHNLTVVAHDGAGHTSAVSTPFYYVGARIAVPAATVALPSIPLSSTKVIP